MGILCKQLKTEHQTEELAKTLARYAVAGDLIRLTGDLGAGKSTFARYFIKALGSQSKHMPSPTYTLVQTYHDTRVPVAHIDCYRLGDPSELEALELNNYITHGIILAEWPDKGGHMLAENQPDLLPYHIQSFDNPGVLTAHFEIIEGDERKVLLTGSNSWQRRFGLFDDDHRRVPKMEDRQACLERWGYKDFRIEMLKQDWSFRTYWRIYVDDKTYVLMDAPSPQESVEEFIAIGDYLNGVGLCAPKIYERDEQNGYLLLEDFGDELVLNLVNKPKEAEKWYEKAIDVQLHLSKCYQNAPVRTYNKIDLWAEVARFVDWYIPYATGRGCTLEERAEYKRLWQPLFDKMLAIPKTLMLHDYHVANMMVLNDAPQNDLKSLGLLDFQDARIGPICCDVSILLRDIRRNRDDALEARMIKRLVAGLEKTSQKEMEEVIHIASLHHTSRILGGLARLAVRDGHPEAVQNLAPRCWEIAMQCFAHPACKNIKTFLEPFQQIRAAA